MQDEIPIIDESNQKKVIIAPHTSSGVVSSTNNRISARDELDALLEGDVAQDSVLGDLEKAKDLVEQTHISPDLDEEANYDYKKMAMTAIKKSGVDIKDSVRVKRLEMLVKSYARKLRSISAVREFLHKKIAIGGMGLPEEKASKLVRAIEGLAWKEYKYEVKEGAEVIDFNSPFSTPVKPVKVDEKEKKDTEERVAKEMEETKVSENKKGFFSKMFSKKKKEDEISSVQEDKKEKQIEVKKDNLRVFTNPQPKKQPESEKDFKVKKDLSGSVQPPKKPTKKQISTEEEKRRALMGDSLVKLETKIGKHIEDELAKEIKGEFTPPAENNDQKEEKYIIKDKLNQVMPQEKGVPPKYELLRAKDAIIPMTEKSTKPVRETLVVAHPLKNSTTPTPTPKISTTSSSRSSRLVGPIDELKYTIEDFRRLSQKPADRVKKIKDKIDILEEESFSNKYLGLRSWMDSEVIHNYIDIGEKSLVDRIPVDTAILFLKKEGKTVLSREEFDIIADINSLLRK